MAIDTPRLRPHHFGISVPNLDDTVAWYRDKLGFTPSYRFELPELAARVAFMVRDGFRVEIFEVDGAEAMPPSRRDPAADLRVQGLKHATFAVDDIERAMADLKGRAWSSRPMWRRCPTPGASASRSSGTTTASWSSSTRRGRRSTPPTNQAREARGARTSARATSRGWGARKACARVSARYPYEIGGRGGAVSVPPP